MANSKVLVGHDVTVYSFSPGGMDDANINVGSATGLLGVWKDIEVEVEETWTDVTPSQQLLKEKRHTDTDWRASMTHQVRTGGASAFNMNQSNDYVYVVFTEELSGKSIQLYGGFARTRLKGDRGERTESVEIINVGDIASLGTSIIYS